MNNPLWSVTIPTYNAAKYLAETLKSVLAQGVSEQEMEIVVVDNCSTDGTVALAQQIGKGRVKIIVNEKNLGMFGNFNKCIEVAQGKLIHLLNADDLVKSGFYQKMGEAFIAQPDVYLIACRADLIDEQGNVTGMTEEPPVSLLTASNNPGEMMYANHMYTPCVVVRRDAYGKVGKFDSSYMHVGDWDMWVRVIANLKGLYINDVLAQYRIHYSSGSNVNSTTGISVTELEKIYKRFADLGFPIDMQRARKRLKQMAEYYYNMYYYSGNKVATANILAMYRRNSSGPEALLLTLKAAIKKPLGALKRSVQK